MFTFTGKERDSETGYSYFGARYYDSDLMTGWLSVDPLADKMLVTAALLCLVNDNLVSPWIAIIILAREFIVSGIRISAASEGNEIAASMWGKVKTVWQFIAICITLVLADFTMTFAFAKIIIDVCMWGAAVLTVISGIDYVVKNIKYLSMK